MSSPQYRPTTYATASASTSRFDRSVSSSMSKWSRTGEKQWEIDAPSPAGMAAAGETLFLASIPPDEQTTMLVVGEDGTELWRHEFDGQIRSLTPAHGRLYAATNDGRVLAFA
jgi:hypothetical protein